MLRRFEQFQFGALNAQRLNELIDAVMQLQQRVQGMAARQEPTKDTILAVITGSGIASAANGSECIPTVVYPFEEVAMFIAKDGPIESGTCITVERVKDGLTSAKGSFLLTMERAPTLAAGTVIKAHLATRFEGSAQDKALVYIATPLAESQVFNATVINVLSEDGKYEAGREGGSDSVIVDVENLYETSGYYGALDDPQNECANLTPRRLRVGDLIPVWMHDGKHYTMAPVAFDVECLPCDTQALAQAQQAPDPIGRDFIAYAMLKR
jgi:hypothetical protein